MHITFSQDDIVYIEATKILRPHAKYGATVNRKLTEIYHRCTGEEVDEKSCCMSERAIFYNNFMEWYESIK